MGYKGLRTKLIHTARTNQPHGAHVPPIYRTATFVEPTDFFYSRISNPTFEFLEKKLVEFEGEAALVFSSGMGAISTTILGLAQNRSRHIVCNFPLYGGTKSLFTKRLPNFGLKFSFVDGRNPFNITEAITDDTAIIFLETPTNPNLFLADIEIISALAKRRKPEILVVVDNTFATPYNQRPLFLGADVALYSITKYLSGFGVIVGGAAVGSKKLIEEIHEWRTDLGTIPSSVDVWDIAVYGLSTFELRMEKHNENALNLAKFLEKQPEVRKVYFPGLKSNPQYELACRQMKTPKGKPGFGGMVSFELDASGDSEAMQRFFDNFSFGKGVSLGFVDTLAECPAMGTHALIPKEEREKEGICDELIRVTVGIENFADIKMVMEKALKATRRPKA